MKKFVSWLLVAVLALGMCSWVSAEETAAVDVIDFSTLSPARKPPAITRRVTW